MAVPVERVLPAAFRGVFRRPVDRAGRMRLLCLCWAGFLLLFFTLSSSQEYYSMPCYPAFAILLGGALAGESRWIPLGQAGSRCDFRSGGRGDRLRF